MGLFGKKSNKVTTYFVFVGRLEGTIGIADERYKHTIFNSLPIILMDQFGKSVDEERIHTSFFEDWNIKKAYDKELISDVKEYGFSGFNTFGDRKTLLDEIEKRMIYKFNVMLNEYHPSVCIFSNSGKYALYSGIYLLCFEQKIKDGKLHRQIYP